MSDHWFEPVAAHLGPTYLRYSHTKGTRQEVDHLVTALRLVPGMRVLDVGCGPGRHVCELANRGISSHGVDISEAFLDVARAHAPPLATFERLDARALPFHAAFDAVLCLCQGGFGMMTSEADDESVLAGIAAAVRPGGGVALTAFNAYFAARYHLAATIDVEHGVCHERTSVHNEVGEEREVDLWTGCYTPRELRLLFRSCGLVVERMSSAEPGGYGDEPVTLELPELLVIARRPG